MKEDILNRIAQLDELLDKESGNEELWIERGTLHWKLQDWQKCIADFDRAISLNEYSTAEELRQMAMDAIAFYYKDRYNP